LTLSNADIKLLSKLKERTGRVEQSKFLIEGKRAVMEALLNSASVDRILVNLGIDSAKFSQIYSLAEERGIVIEEVPAAKFAKLSSTETSQGIIAIAEITTFTFDDLISQLRSKRNALVIVLDKVSDPGNLGTILRSASWFGVDAVLTGEGSVDIYNSKVVRSAMSAIASLNVVQEIKPRDTMSKLKSLGFAIVASTQNGKKSYSEYVFPPKSCLVFGSEATGIDKRIFDLCDESVMIPRIGKMESLNVGVACSIVMAELIRQRSA